MKKQLMTETTPDNIDKLVKLLAPKGKKVEPVNKKSYYPRRAIKIGRVLELMDRKVGGRNEGTSGLSHNQELIELWGKCGLDRGLQEIIKKSGYEIIHEPLQRLKAREARRLFEFLLDLFFKKQLCKEIGKKY